MRRVGFDLGRWLRLDNARSTETVWLRGEWEFPEVPFDAWIRVAANRSFDLFVNGRRIVGADPHGIQQYIDYELAQQKSAKK